MNFQTLDKLTPVVAAHVGVSKGGVPKGGESNGDVAHGCDEVTSTTTLTPDTGVWP